jgi:copper transport protein
MLARMARPTIRRLALVALAGAMAVALLPLLGPARPVEAHAVVISTSPPAGALLERAPAEVVVAFTEPVTAEPDSIVVIDAEGAVASGPAEARGTSVVASLDAGSSGWHAVSWWVVSTDGHPISGAWTFRVGEGDDLAPEGLEARAAAAARSSDTARWAFFVTQWFSTLAAVVAVGTVFVITLLGFTRPLTPLALGSTVLAAVTSVLAAGTNGPYASVSRGWFDGPASDHLLGRAALFAVVAVVLAATRPRADRPPGPVLARAATLVLATGGLVLPVLTGHARAEGDAATLVVMLHLVVAAAWLGATPAMLLLVRQGGSVQHPLAVFSRAATWLLAGAVAAGGAGVWMLTGGLGNASQAWVWALFVKVSLVGVAVTAGAWNRWNVVPRADELPRPQATVALRVEAIAVVLIVAASLALTHNGPPQATEIGRGGPVVVDAALSDGLRMQLIVDPARVGANDIHLFLLDPTGMPVEVEEVTVTLSSAELGVGRIEQALSNLGAGHYSGRSTDLGSGGTWELHLVIRPDPFSQVDRTESFEVGG